MVSVDEAYLNVGGTERLFGSAYAAAHQLHQAVADRTRLPCSIGVSRSRLVSKIASDQAKPNGVLFVQPGCEAAFLAPLLVGKIPGVGKTTEKQLHAMGVARIKDLLWMGEQALRDRLGGHGDALYAIASGSRFEAGESPWHDDDAAKSLSHEETFAVDVSEAGVLDSTLADLAQRVARRLRRQGLFGRTVTLKLRYSNFQTLTRARTLAQPTQIDGVLLEAARELLAENWDRRRKVRLLGLQVSGLASTAGQANLLTAETEAKWNRALAAADRLRNRYGFGAVQLGSAVAGSGRSATVGHPPPGPVKASK
jgi:DNA polymerase-4